MKKIIFITAAAILLTGCSINNIENDSLRKSEMLMDTIVTIEAYGTNDEALLDECFRIGKKYEQLLSKTVTESEIDKINTAKGKSVEVSSETVQLIEKAMYYGRLSDGVFDITIAKINELWDFKSENPVLPNQEEIHSLLYTVDYKKIRIEQNSVTMEEPEAAIDLGGIAKGYIGDKMKEFLQAEGIESAMVNLGGDVVTIGSKPDGSSWNIGIQKPFDEMNEVIDSVSVENQAVVSSGSYERYFEKGGRIYHHILDSGTGYPVQNGLASATVVTGTAADGDALSTACFALGLEKGLELIESLEDTEAIFITDTEEIVYSSGFTK